MRRDQRTVFGTDPEAYDRVRPGYPPAMLDTVSAVTGIRWSSGDLTTNPLFGVVLHWRQNWVESYDADQYARLLAVTPGTRPSEAR